MIFFFFFIVLNILTSFIIKMFKGLACVGSLNCSETVHFRQKHPNSVFVCEQSDILLTSTLSTFIILK